MKLLLLLGTIAALALTSTGQAQSLETTTQAPVVTRHRTQTITVAPSRSRSVVTYRNGARYDDGRTSVAVGVGGYYHPGYYDYAYGYPYDYAYDYGYPYSYGYTSYPSDYYYTDEYPTAYTTTTTRYVTTGYGDLAYDDNIVIAVQQRLARAGYYLGAIDGVAGPATRSAIARWEGNHGMYADGRIDARTLSSMGISVNG